MKDREKQKADQWIEAHVERESEREVDLWELLYCLLDNVRIIIAAALAGALLMAICSFMWLTPIYEATCYIYVTNTSDSAINLSDFQIGNYLKSDYELVFQAWEVHQAVRENLGLDYSYDELRSMVEVSNPSDTRVLCVTVSSEDPQEAAALANEYANVASEYISRTMDMNRPAIFSSALVPDKPVRPRKLRNTVLGFVVGALIMIGFLTLRFVLDDKIKTSDDIAKNKNMAVLAVVPENADSQSHKRSKKMSRRRVLQ